MRVNRSIVTRLAPLAAAVLLAVGSLILIIVEDNEQSQDDYDHLKRHLLSTRIATLTEEQNKLQDSLVCNAIQNNDDEIKATTIFMGTEPTKPYQGCFISAIFGLSSSLTDRPLNVTSDLQSKYPDYAFLMFTNLVDLDAPGWQTFLHFDPSKKRMITQSRYPKFMAWKEEFVQRYCPVVFYLDGAQRLKEPVGAFDTEKMHVLAVSKHVCNTYLTTSSTTHTLCRPKRDLYNAYTNPSKKN